MSCQIIKAADLAGQPFLLQAKERDMTHSADEFETNPPFSSPCSAPPIEPVSEKPAVEGGHDVAPQPNSGPDTSTYSDTVVQLPVSASEREQSFEH